MALVKSYQERIGYAKREGIPQRQAKYGRRTRREGEREDGRVDTKFSTKN
jgi:hypothetical protein